MLVNIIHSVPRLSTGGPEKWSMLAKRGGGPALFEFLGGSGFFRGGVEGLLKVIFNC